VCGLGGWGGRVDRPFPPVSTPSRPYNPPTSSHASCAAMPAHRPWCPEDTRTAPPPPANPPPGASLPLTPRASLRAQPPSPPPHPLASAPRLSLYNARSSHTMQQGSLLYRPPSAKQAAADRPARPVGEAAHASRPSPRRPVQREGIRSARGAVRPGVAPLCRVAPIRSVCLAPTPRVGPRRAGTGLLPFLLSRDPRGWKRASGGAQRPVRLREEGLHR
jgi:hypothetical protein